MNIGARITEARRARGWSPSQLAAELGVAPCYILQLEDGYFCPSLQMAKLLGTVLHEPAAIFHDTPTSNRTGEQETRPI